MRSEPLSTCAQVCPPATREDIERFQSAMTVCFGRAVDAGLSIAVSPRLDDGLNIGGWRNGELSALDMVGSDLGRGFDLSGSPAGRRFCTVAAG